MADQATVNRDGARFNGKSLAGTTPGANGSEASVGGVVSNVAGLGENLLTLAELQARLTSVELRQNVESAKSGGAMIMAGALLAFSSVPIAMVATAELLVSELGFKRGYALLTVAAMVAALAVGCVAIGRRWLTHKPLGFPLSAEEFARNMNWLRTILRHSGRWPLNR